jgi:hypothetical protein
LGVGSNASPHLIRAGLLPEPGGTNGADDRAVRRPAQKKDRDFLQKCAFCHRLSTILDHNWPCDPGVDRSIRSSLIRPPRLSLERPDHFFALISFTNLCAPLVSPFGANRI